MIPSEFNQDAKAARRKLQLLTEARTKFKVGQSVAVNFPLARDMKQAGLATRGKITKIKPLAGGSNVKLTVKWSDGREKAALGSNVHVVKEESITEAVSIVAADNRTGEVILKVLGVRSSPGSPSKEETRLALLADRIGGAVFKPVGSRVSSAFGGGKNLFSFKVERFKKPEDVAKLLRKELGNLFKS